MGPRPVTLTLHSFVSLASLLLLASVACGGGGGSSGGDPSSPPPPLAAACPTARLTGTTHYFCDCQANHAEGCKPGDDDANDGLSDSAPRRTLGRAMSTFASMGAGDTVALCRGGSWTDWNGGHVENATCTASSPCDLRDYGDVSLPRPRLNIAGDTTLFLLQSGVVDGVRVWNMDFRGSDFTVGTVFLVQGQKTNLDVCGSRFENMSLGLNLQVASSGASGITIRGNEFVGTGFSAILGGANGMVVDGNLFQNNGLNNTPQQHSIYLAGQYQGERVTNNRFTTDERCGGVMLVIHEQQTDLLVQNNDFFTSSTDADCYATQSASSNAYGEFHDVRWIRNRIVTQGSTGIEAAACTDCLVSDNIVVGGGIHVGRKPEGNMGPTTRVTVRNNSVYRGRIGFYDTGAGYVLENNAVWTDDGSCFSLPGAMSRNGYNYCRTGGGAPPSSIWADAPGGDFTPASPGPLIEAGSPVDFSPVAIGSVTWSAADEGRARTRPTDIGAMIH